MCQVTRSAGVVWKHIISYFDVGPSGAALNSLLWATHRRRKGTPSPGYFADRRLQTGRTER